MKIELAFGKTGIAADLPEGFRYRVLEARTATPLPDWQGALESALDRPIGYAAIGRARTRQTQRRDFGLRHHAARLPTA